MGCPELVQLRYMQCNDIVEPALPRIVPNLPSLPLYITTLIRKNTNMNSGQLARTKHENKYMKEGIIEWERYTTRTKSIHDNEILGLPRLLFVPLNNVEPAQFGNPAERRLLEIPDARVCTVHYSCDRKAKHFRSSMLN